MLFSLPRLISHLCVEKIRPSLQEFSTDPHRCQRVFICRIRRMECDVHHDIPTVARIGAPVFFFPERAIIPLLLMKMKNSEKNPPCHRSFSSQAHACEKKEKQKSPSRVRHGKGAEHLRNRRVEFQTLSPLTLHWDTSPGQTVEPALSFRRILARCSAM